MWKVDIYAETSIPPMKRGNGAAIYLLETFVGNEERTLWDVVRAADCTQNRAVLLAVDAALARITTQSKITLHTSCGFVKAAVNSRWPDKWKEAGWENGKGNAVTDQDIWQSITERESWRDLDAAAESEHKYQNWMRHELERSLYV